MTSGKQPDLLGLSLQQLTAVGEALGEAAYRGRQLFDALYRQRKTYLSQITNLPLSLRNTLSEQYQIGVPNVERQFRSIDGTIRYLIALADGQTVETVWMPEGDGGDIDADPEAIERDPSANFDRATICVSSQVGCAVNCQFCMTALLGVKRNLTAGEIVGQVIAVLNERGVAPETERINLVFMGMGEPFLNYDNFMQAMRLLVEGLGIPERRMTVSTAGIVPRIYDFASEPIRPKLAISLN